MGRCRRRATSRGNGRTAGPVRMCVRQEPVQEPARRAQSSATGRCRRRVAAAGCGRTRRPVRMCVMAASVAGRACRVRSNARGPFRKRATPTAPGKLERRAAGRRPALRESVALAPRARETATATRATAVRPIRTQALATVAPARQRATGRTARRAVAAGSAGLCVPAGMGTATTTRQTAARSTFKPRRIAVGRAPPCAMLRTGRQPARQVSAESPAPRGMRTAMGTRRTAVRRQGPVADR